MHEYVKKIGPRAYTSNSDSLAYAAANRAAENGHTRFIHEMAKARLNIRPNENGFGPVHFAAQNGHADVIEELALHFKPKDLHTGTRENQSGWAIGFRPLDLAARNGHVEVVRTLLKHGAGDFLNYYSTAVHEAAQNGQVEVLRLLDEAYEKKRNSDKRYWIPTHKQTDDEGNLGLHLAAKNGHKAAVEWFLKKGADAHATNSDGKKARQLTKDQEIKDLLKKAEFHSSTTGKIISAIRYLKRH